jgi:Trk-type K+ transport system membrane component
MAFPDAARQQSPPRGAGPHSPRFGLAALRDTVDEVARSSPARLAVSVFAFVVLVFTALLSLPVATTSGVRAPLPDAFFLATSAVCVTGLTTVNIPEYWSGFGQVVLLLGMQIGGLGVLTLASILGLAVSRRLGLRQRLIAASETKALSLGEVGSLLRAIITMVLSIEAVIALLLTGRFLVRGEAPGLAIWHGIFYAVSSFNNVGFVPHLNGLEQFVGDPWVCLPLMLGVFIGSLGFPVLFVLTRTPRPRDWDLHTRLTLAATTALLVVAIVLIGSFEWGNPSTFGPLSGGQKVLASLFAGVMPRSGGFATVDVGQMHETTWLVTDALMFVGGGSASTAGGVRVTTMAVLFLAVVAEARGDRDVEFSRRRIPLGSIRIAITVILVGATVVLVGTLVVMAVTGLRLDVVLLEVISAFATCGLSTGITPHLPPEAKYVLAVVMFVGRTGTMTLAGALALRERTRMFRLPEERPIVG